MVIVFQVQLIEQDRMETYISSLEKELLVCKTKERELVVDRANLVDKIRLIHGILEDKQKQVNFAFFYLNFKYLLYTIYAANEFDVTILDIRSVF